MEELINNKIIVIAMGIAITSFLVVVIINYLINKR